jgi:hypothetical protein
LRQADGIIGHDKQEIRGQEHCLDLENHLTYFRTDIDLSQALGVEDTLPQ